MHLVRPPPSPPPNLLPKFYMSIVFDFSWDGYKTQEKWKTKVASGTYPEKIKQGSTPRRKFQKPIPCEDKELITYFKFFLQNNALDLKFLFSPPLVNMVRSPIF